MKIDSFRIKYFRSIVDSGWQNFSRDGVTVFVGQNESGKSSVLEALTAANGRREISEDDFRAELHPKSPEVYLRFRLDSHDEIAEWFEEESYDALERSLLTETFKLRNNLIVLKYIWTKDEDKPGYKRRVSVDDEEFEDAFIVLKESRRQKNDVANPSGLDVTATGDVTALRQVSLNDICNAVFDWSPAVVLVEQNVGILPDTVDIVESSSGYTLTGAGAAVANNFLAIADLRVSALVQATDRQRASMLKKANDSISKDFALFWGQKIGRTENLQLECDMAIYRHSDGEKSGKPYLRFWISDGLTKLYPKQRSLGVRWFTSFYLQIKASEKRGSRPQYMLDEPGANLHPRAQLDVLKLINELSKEIPIAYSTHSAHMIEYEKLYRVIAVQREGDENDSPTTFIDAHRLGSASQDTLSPVLSAMGIDLSHQRVIKETNNVLLEEMSGYYYLRAFWKLTETTQVAHFIAASGVDNIPKFANMFRGWGLDFIVAVDDDSQARVMCKGLVRHHYGDDEMLARQNIFKFPDCKGIEDVFSEKDFKEFVIKEPKLESGKSNSDLMKSGSRSKPVTACKFLLDVESGVLQWAQLEEQTQQKISAIVSGIADRLQEKEKEKLKS